MNGVEDKEIVITQEQEPKNPADPTKWNQKFNPGDDKIEHGLAGILIAFGMFFIWSQHAKKAWVGYIAVISIAIAIGIMYGKEVMDAWGLLWKGTPDIWDFYCGLMGICVAIPLIVLYSWVRVNKD